jgi:hypothetical protein
MQNVSRYCEFYNEPHLKDGLRPIDPFLNKHKLKLRPAEEIASRAVPGDAKKY